MHIAIDLRCLTHSQNNERGIGHYTTSHLMAVIPQCPSWQFSLYVELGQEQHRSIEPFASLAGSQIRPFSSWRRDTLPDLFHIPDPISLIFGYDSPFRVAPQGVPLTSIFYDLIPLVKRELHLPAGSEVERAYFERLHQIKESGATFLTISENTSRDLQKLIGIPQEKIVTIMAGLHSDAAEPPDDTVQDEALRRFGITKPFFLAVGGLDPHKNFRLTASAYSELSRQIPMQLVVVGSEGDPYKGMFQEMLAKNGVHDVIFTGYVERKVLNALYARARALCFPSLYEGFGLPVLEAMAHGCPSIITNKSSLPEVAGDSGIIISEDSGLEMAQAMHRLLTDDQYRSELAAKGRARLPLFTWKRVAERTLEAWNRILESRKSPSDAPNSLSADEERARRRAVGLIG